MDNKHFKFYIQAAVALLALFLFIYVPGITANSKYVFDILFGNKTNFYFDYGGYAENDNCRFKQILKDSKDYFLKLSSDLDKKGVKLTVSKQLKENSMCKEGSMYGIRVTGLDKPFESRFFLISHWITLRGIQYITEIDEYTENEFRESVELKELYQD